MKTWKTKSADADFVRRLTAELRLPPILARVLSGYGFSEVAAAARFLDPRLQDVSDPFLIPQMDKAVIRIWRAIAAQETILIYGDYDVDGIAATALLTRVLVRLGCPNVITCLPVRQEEGYGFTVAALQKRLGATRPGLIITVDCGITAVATAAFVRKAAIDLIITDHHEIGPALPDALAVINPKLGNSVSLKMLAGVGVAFKLCHALVKYGRTQKNAGADFDLREYLDLVAAGTVADQVPLLEENRILVRHGLARINCSNAPAWRSLKEVAALSGHLDTYHLAFCVAPRLNAAGRLASAETALELFITGDEARALLIARELDKANRERQAIEAQILKEAMEEIDAYFDPAVHFGIAVARRAWHIGVIGIVAARLAARYNRPVVVIGFADDGSGRGSARSIAGYNILRGLELCRNELTAWGGHEMAAGVEIEERSFKQFQKFFNQAAAREMKGKNLVPVQTINAWIKLDDVSDENFNALEQLAPFGQDNPKPVFAARGVKVAAPPRVVGKKHLRFSVSSGRTTVGAIAFNHVARATGLVERELPEGLLDIAFQIRKNSFGGSEKLELNILDYRQTLPADGND